MDKHEKYMGIALEHAREAMKQGEFPVGSVIVSGDEIISTGMRENSRHTVNEFDHGEMVALRRVLSAEKNYDMSGLWLYSTMEPCLMCYSTLLLNGVRNFVFAYEDVMGGGTNLDLTRLNPLYVGMKVNIIKDVLRIESLKLFQDFFSNPNNIYWQDSLLSLYTLEQRVDR